MNNFQSIFYKKNISFPTVIGLLSIVIFAFIIRWYNLPQRGIISRDEAWYVFSARGLETRFLYWFNQGLDVHPYASSELPDFERISSNNVSGKPTYVVILWLLGLFHKSLNYETVLSFSVFAGVSEIVAVYFLSRKANLDLCTSLLASLCASLSFSNIYFSRIGYPHSFLITIHTLALYFYLDGIDKKPLNGSLFLAGLLWGVGLSTHMSLVLAIPGLLVSEIYLFRRKIINSWNVLFKRSTIWGIGILIVLFGWELLYRIASIIMRDGPGIISISGSFFGDLVNHAGSGGVNSNPFINLLFYGFALLGMENILIFIFFLFGIIYIWQREDIGVGVRILSLFFASNFFFLVIYPASYGRQLFPLFSTWPLFVAFGITVFWELGTKSLFKNKRIFVITGIFFICIFSLYWDWPLLTSGSSGWVKASKYLKTKITYGDLIFTNEISDAAILNYYLPGRVLMWPSGEIKLPSQTHWYVGNLSQKQYPSWLSVKEIIDGKLPSKAFSDSWMLLRPHSVMSGNWLLIPWWRWSVGPKSYKPGIDNNISIYSIH